MRFIPIFAIAILIVVAAKIIHYNTSLNINQPIRTGFPVARRSHEINLKIKKEILLRCWGKKKLLQVVRTVSSLIPLSFLFPPIFLKQKEHMAK